MKELKIMRSFRLSPEKDALLRAMAAKMGLNQTQVIENALSWYNIVQVKAVVDAPELPERIYKDAEGVSRSAADCIYDEADLLAAELLLGP